MADQHGVVARRVETAVDGVMQGWAGQSAAAIEEQRLIKDEIAFVGGQVRLGGRRRNLDLVGDLVEVAAGGGGFGLDREAHRAASSLGFEAPWLVESFAASMAWARSARKHRLVLIPT